MKLVSSFVILFLSAVLANAEPNQLVINVERQDFKPLQDVSWRVTAGSSNITRSTVGNTFSGTGLGIGIEKIASQKWSFGAHYANINGVTSGFTGNTVYDPNSGNYLAENYEFRENQNVLTGYGKFSFVNYPINQWNLVQVSLLGGVTAYDKHSDNLHLVYGVAASYNFDNMIGFELSNRVNFKAEATTNANLVGYF